jgi:hypothetical protein
MCFKLGLSEVTDWEYFFADPKGIMPILNIES